MDHDNHVLITGASGFIGAHLTTHLVDMGYSVRTLVRRTSDLSALEGLRLDHRYGDLTAPETLPPALEGVRVVFHLAGITRTIHRREYYRVNVQGTRALLEACLSSPDLERFVYVSSAAAAGPSREGRPRVETDQPDPVGPYGESKLAGETACIETAGEELPVTIVRPCAVYGPWERDILELFRWSRRRIAPIVAGDTVMSLIHARDLADLIERAARPGSTPGRTYFAADPEYYSVREMLRIMGSIFDRRAIPVPLPPFLVSVAAFLNEQFLRAGLGVEVLTRSRARELRRRYWAFDSTLAQEELGWRPEHTIEEGFRETAEWYMEKGWL